MPRRSGDQTARPEPREHDAELVKRSAAGDADAFRQLYEEKHRRVYLIAYQMLGDPGLAEDVVQETFVALWKHCGRYRARFAVDTWLNRIATNRAIDRWRSEKKHPKGGVAAEHATGSDDSRQGRPIAPTSATAAAAGPAAGTASADPSLPARWNEVQAIWNELAAGLSPQQRAAFVLREIEELPVRDVAEAMECSVSTVRSHISLARRTLRAALVERFPELVPPAGGGTDP